ncbi:DUF819 domain-containing protein [Sinobaca sp. H24]|uniref:DUF819 family protein n=1 Tax=Sinobaca sp. H24 TaxID=2923376 RepID=UPI00207A6AF4|nr:DUF819 family protein [Sinobaca sp. H24]
MGEALISPDDYWVLWGFLAIWAAVSIYLEQTYQWASKISGAIIALLGAMILTNINVLPVESPVYDAVWSYIVPLAIPLLLFQVNLKKIWKESSRILFIFLISSIGTVAGTTLAFLALKDVIPELDKIGAIITGSYIGGGVNFAAMAAKFETPGELVSATVVADNLMMASYFFVLIAIPAIGFFRKNYRTPYIEEVEREAQNTEGKTISESFWSRKDISLKDIALSIGTAFLLVVVSFKLAEWFASIIPSGENVFWFYAVLGGVLGDSYLMLTTITIAAVSWFPRKFEAMNGSQEFGTYFIYIFFVVIGIPASLPIIFQNAPLLLVFVAIVVIINMLISFTLGKFFNFSLEEIILATNANVGGPTTAAAMAIARGWKDLIVPILLIGTLGYIIGNYIATAMGLWFSTFF